MLGMVEGNGHPYSWSAIINGEYDPVLLAASAYPMISRYLDTQPSDALGILGARVTHIWCDRRQDAEHVARCTRIDNVVDRAEDVIGHVDAVFVATDIGAEHLERARPFVDAGLPAFIDKPLTERVDHLQQFVRWHAEGRPLVSTSAMRYANEFKALRNRLHEVGEPRLITVTMMKSWERYGIHALEAVYGLLAPGGWRSVTNTGNTAHNVVHATHASGVEVIVCVVDDMAGAFGHVCVYGTAGRIDARFSDTFSAFKSQLVAFIDYLRTGTPPVAFAETVEQMRIVIAGIRSRDSGGRRIDLSEIRA